MILSLAASLLFATTGTCTATGHAAMAHHRAVAAPTNTICPVLGNPMTPGKSAVVTVRGHAYYVCCSDCKAKLEAHPAKYLAKDGTPLNAAKPSSGSMGGMKM
jgi:YHS domain-containing protein